MRFHHVILGGLLAVIAAGPASADDATTKFDGTYLGHLIQTSGRGCGYSGNVKMPVKNGAFTWKQNNIATQIMISGAGDISGVGNTSTISGKATPTGLDFDSNGSGCSNRWHFDKQ